MAVETGRSGMDRRAAWIVAGVLAVAAAIGLTIRAADRDEAAPRIAAVDPGADPAPAPATPSDAPEASAGTELALTPEAPDTPSVTPRPAVPQPVAPSPVASPPAATASIAPQQPAPQPAAPPAADIADGAPAPVSREAPGLGPTAEGTAPAAEGLAAPRPESVAAAQAPGPVSGALPVAPVPGALPEEPAPAMAALPAPGDPPVPGALPLTGVALPAFDLVRVEPGGATLVAGSAEPGGTVFVLVDGTAIGDTVAGRDGKFAAFVDIAPGPDARVLSLEQEVAGRRLVSEEEVILAPRVAVAAVEEPAEADADAPSEGGDPARADTATPAAGDRPAAPAPRVMADAPARPGDDTVAATGTPAGPAEAAPGAGPGIASDGAATAFDAAPGTAPVPILSSADGIAVLGTAPLPPGEVALDAIRYDARGAVQVSGRGSGGFVRIYLDNTPVTTSRIGDGGRWRVTLPEVDAGTYTLRVDQVDAGGTVTARVESPFRRESPAALDAARAGLMGSAGSVVVQPGNTLWGISRIRYGEGIAYVRVFEANRDRIRDPDLIYPGQIFDLPE